MSEPQLVIEREPALLRLTINRPAQRNALRMDLLDEIGQVLGAHYHDKALKCAVITATGDKAFAAGGDLKELDAVRSGSEARAMSRRGRGALNLVRNFPVPVIAALNGLALGGGAELAMACDQRVAAAHAEIGFLQGKLNVTPAWGGGIDLVATVGPHRAMTLLASARRVAGEELAALGMVDYLCQADEPLADGLATFLAPYLERPPQVLRGIKAVTGQARWRLHQRHALTEQEHFVTAWIHEDHWNALG